MLFVVENNLKSFYVGSSRLPFLLVVESSSSLVQLDFDLLMCRLVVESIFEGFCQVDFDLLLVFFSVVESIFKQIGSLFKSISIFCWIGWLVNLF